MDKLADGLKEISKEFPELKGIDLNPRFSKNLFPAVILYLITLSSIFKGEPDIEMAVILLSDVNFQLLCSEGAVGVFLYQLKWLVELFKKSTYGLIHSSEEKLKSIKEMAQLEDKFGKVEYIDHMTALDGFPDLLIYLPLKVNKLIPYNSSSITFKIKSLILITYSKYCQRGQVKRNLIRIFKLINELKYNINMVHWQTM